MSIAIDILLLILGLILVWKGGDYFVDSSVIRRTFDGAPIGWWPAWSLVIVFTWARYLAPAFGAILLTVSIAYLFVDYWNIRQRRASRIKGATEVVPEAHDQKKPILLFLVGIAMVILGSRILVTSGVSIATALGIPSVIIGLGLIQLLLYSVYIIGLVVIPMVVAI